MLTPRILTIVTLPLLAFTVTASAQTVEPRAAIAQALGRLPLYFVENRGYPDAVRDHVQGTDKSLFFTGDGVTFALRGEERGWTVKLDFVGANENVRPEGRDKQSAVISYFKGAEKDWKAGLPTFSKIVYRDLWPGIDLVYRGTVNKIKYEFVVAPGADPAKIRLHYRGVESLECTAEGALKVTTPAGSFEDAPPVAWQEIDGERVPVAMAYAVGEDGAFTFDVGEYDAQHPLVLDPAVIVYCGYLGGNQWDRVAAVAVDKAGAMYVAGETASTSGFPVRVGPDLSYNQQQDAFVAKVNPAGTALVYCGYIGGPSFDFARDIAIDSGGSAYVVGQTRSVSGFPLRVGPSLRFGGRTDGFIAKVNAGGTALDFCGYIGGSDLETAQGVAVDGQGCAYVTGDTRSTDFPVRSGPFTTHGGGNVDAFVSKVNAAGTGFVYSGYLGGSGYDTGGAIAVDTVGQAFVTGRTDSAESSFPVKGTLDPTYNGGVDGFVAKVNGAGTGLVYCGYLGGSSADFGIGIAVDTAGSAFVVGYTSSSEATFPAKVGPDTTYNGNRDGYVAKVRSDGTSLVYCGYIGGADDDRVEAVAEVRGALVAVGQTKSTESSFPVTGGPDSTQNGDHDGFVALVDSQGTALISCGYIGGIGYDGASGLAVDTAGNAYLGGIVRSDQNTFPVKGPLDPTYNGGLDDAFVAKVSFAFLEASGTPRPGGTVNLTLTATDDAGLTYQLGSSFRTGPIQLGNRQIGLGLDDLLVVSVRGFLPMIFGNYAGVIGTNGQANASINIPNWSVLVGNTIHTAFVTLSASAPQGVKSISNTYSFTMLSPVPGHRLHTDYTPSRAHPFAKEASSVSVARQEP